jgi:hypothetical protein
LAFTCFTVQVCTATGTESLAIRPAQRLLRQRQEDLLSDDSVHIYGGTIKKFRVQIFRSKVNLFRSICRQRVQKQQVYGFIQLQDVILQTSTAPKAYCSLQLAVQLDLFRLWDKFQINVNGSSQGYFIRIFS